MEIVGFVVAVVLVAVVVFVTFGFIESMQAYRGMVGVVFASVVVAGVIVLIAT